MKPLISLPRNNLQLLFAFTVTVKRELVEVTAANADHITAAVLGSFEKACIYLLITSLASLLIRQMSCLDLITRWRFF